MEGENARLKTTTDLNELDRKDLQSFLENISEKLKYLENCLEMAFPDKLNNEEAEKKLARTRRLLLVSFFSVFAAVIIVAHTADSEEVMRIGSIVILASFALLVGKVTYDFLMGAKRSKAGKVEAYQSMSKSLYEYKDELQECEPLINVIPPEYRMSIVLDRFCYYLSSELAGSWKECVLMFEDDKHKENMEEKANRIIANSKRMRRYLTNIDTFAAVADWNRWE